MTPPTNPPKFRYTSGRMFELLIVVCLVSVLAVWLSRNIQEGQGSERSHGCRTTLRALGVAMHSFRDRYCGVFPPVTMALSPGEAPAHSWRALLCPYYLIAPIQYQPDEPWNGPSNAGLLSAECRQLRCTSEEPLAPQDTSYVAVVEEGFFFAPKISRRFDDISDELGNTIMVVELARSGIHWLDPRDVSWEEFWQRYEASDVSRHRGRFQAVMADGSVRIIPYGLDQPTLRALFTIAGGEPPYFQPIKRDNANPQ